MFNSRFVAPLTQTALRLLGTVSLLFAGLGAQPASAQETTPSAGQIRVPLLIEARGGEAPRSVSADEVAIEVNGTGVPAEIDSPSSRQVTLYVDSALSSKGSVRRAADRLLSALPELLEAAEFEIVVADPVPRILLPATSRPDTARNALDRLFLTLEPEDAIEQLRGVFAQGQARLRAGSVTESALDEARLDAAEAETAAVRKQQDRLLLWLDERPVSSGEDRILLLVNDALDHNAFDHYAATLGQSADRSAAERALLQATSARASLSDLAAVAAARGWGLTTLAPPAEDEQGLEYAPDEDTPVGFRIRLGNAGRDPEAGEGDVDERLFEPRRDQWASLSDATGAVTLGRPSGRRNRVDTTADLVNLVRGRFIAEIPSRFADQELTISSPRSSWTIKTPNRVPAPAPRALAMARLRSAFDDGSEAGDDLDVDASLALGVVTGQRDAAELRVDLGSVGLDAGRPLRLSVAVHTQEDEIAVQHYERDMPATTSRIRDLPVDGDVDPNTDPDPSEDESTAADPVDGNVDPMVERIPLRLPPAADSVAVIVTDLHSGRWGLAFADLNDSDRAAAAEAASANDRPRAITLLPLPEGPQTGKITVRTRVSEEVSRVLFFLNGKRAGRRSRAPFDATINLGPRTRTSQLVVAAFDRNGKELDRDRMLINEPPQAFWVRIIEPEPGGFAAGPVDVEAQLKIPQSAELEKVDFYWKDRLLKTALDPPYRRTVRIPLNEPDGYLRVEARLRDGRVAEDVLVTSQAGFGETIGVELVELYVVATDRRGKPVQGLKETDFRVVEDGDPQTLESFTVAGNLPLTVGLAIDSSSSLFLKMPEVQDAASKFVSSLRDGTDRAFLIGFGSEPALIRSVTGDLGSVERSIGQLEPYGATAVWGAINLSLEQLETVNGRRALVVFYDGDDEDRERDFESSMKLARRARVPVYLIVLNDEAARTSGRSLSSRSFANRLERIGRVGGGRVYFVGEDDELDPIFESISEELRSHYLLTYYPQLEPGGPLWRPVEVEVLQRGIDARTVEGRELEF